MYTVMNLKGILTIILNKDKPTLFFTGAAKERRFCPAQTNNGLETNQFIASGECIIILLENLQPIHMESFTGHITFPSVFSNEWQNAFPLAFTTIA